MNAVSGGRTAKRGFLRSLFFILTGGAAGAGVRKRQRSGLVGILLHEGGVLVGAVEFRGASLGGAAARALPQKSDGPKARSMVGPRTAYGLSPRTPRLAPPCDCRRQRTIG